MRTNSLLTCCAISAVLILGHSPPSWAGEAQELRTQQCLTAFLNNRPCAKAAVPVDDRPGCHTLDGKPCPPRYDESDEGGAADEQSDKEDAAKRHAKFHAKSCDDYEDISDPNISLNSENLSEACLGNVDLSHKHMEYANFSKADLSAADLRYADAQHADFHNANLIGADFRGADLRGADLRGANLRDASFTGANMCGAKVEVADLMLAGKFTREDMRGVKLDWSDAAIDWRLDMYKSEKKRYAAMRRYWRVTYSCKLEAKRSN